MNVNHRRKVTIYLFSTAKNFLNNTSVVSNRNVYVTWSRLFLARK